MKIPLKQILFVFHPLSVYTDMQFILSSRGKNNKKKS